MKFRSISFHNYRCFIDGTVTFENKNDKSITLIVGKNGGGKTEMLFAFWWVLYGFDFKELQNKDETPYALNETLYKKIFNEEITISDCSVSLEFEHENTRYLVTRKAVYTLQQNHKLKIEEYQTLSHYDSNDTLSVPLRDDDLIKKELMRIIPKSILYGIVFDGERMKLLSSSDANARKAIKGVINDITNVDLLESCITEFEQQKAAINKRSRKLAKEAGQYTLDEVIQTIADAETERNNIIAEQEETKEKLENIELELSLLSSQLSEITETRELEAKRNILKEEIQEYTKTKHSYLSEFSDSLKNGSLLLCKKLFDDVRDLLTNYDIPVGLTVEAVDNILKRDRCICGEEWTPKMREALEDLKKSLPPDNINSTIGETVRLLENQVLTVKGEVQKDYSHLNEINRKIFDKNESLASLSVQISSTGISNVAEIEDRYNYLQQQLGICNERLRLHGLRLPELDKVIKQNSQRKAGLMDTNAGMQEIDKELGFVSKCIIALNSLKEVNNQTALKRINDKIVESYNLLCDEVNYGRRIHIIQYDNTQCYKLVSYMEQQLDNEIQRMHRSGEYDQEKSSGKSNEEIIESAIIRCALPNSTGQSKMNTLAFAKAILDYSNERKEENNLEISKSYPFLIDAPFGDVFDKNLIMSASALHTFSDQIVLMISKDSYDSIAEYIDPYVSSVFLFRKHINESVSSIEAFSLNELKQLGGDEI